MSSEFGEFFVSSIALIDTYETALRPDSLSGTLSTSEIIKLKTWHQIKLLPFYYCQLRVARYDYLSLSLVTEPTFRSPNTLLFSNRFIIKFVSGRMYKTLFANYRLHIEKTNS